MKKDLLKNFNLYNYKNNYAFTLIELLVVIAIIGILSGLIIVGMSNATNSANDAKRKANIETIRKALMMYQANNGGLYPTGTNEALGCTINGGTTPCSVLASALGTLLPNPPTDPSGSFYTYRSNGTNFTISAALSNSIPYNYYSLDGFNSVDNTGLVANWPMHEGSGSTVADNAGLNTGTIFNSPAWGTDNRMYFDGSDEYISIGNNAPIKLSLNSFTMSFWGKLNFIDIELQHANVIIGKRTGAWADPLQAGYEINIGGSGNTLVFWLDDGATLYNHSLPVDKTKYQHYIFIFSRTENKIQAYLNGVKNGSDVSTSPTFGSIINSLPLEIMRRVGGGYNMRGYIDDVRIYNKALSAAEVTALYNLQKTTHP